MINFAFEQVGVERLEAWCAVKDGRGDDALQMGAVREAVRRKSFLKDGPQHAQNLWPILRADVRWPKAVWSERVH